MIWSCLIAGAGQFLVALPGGHAVPDRRRRLSLGPSAVGAALGLDGGLGLPDGAAGHERRGGDLRFSAELIGVRIVGCWLLFTERYHGLGGAVRRLRHRGGDGSCLPVFLAAGIIGLSTVLRLGAVVIGAGLLYMVTTRHYGRSDAKAGDAIPTG